MVGTVSLVINIDLSRPYCFEALNEKHSRKSATTDLVVDVPLCLVNAVRGHH